MKASYSVSKRSGFTLVEILVVICVIAVLAAVTVGLLGPVENSIRTSNAKTQCHKIALALDNFKNTYGEYPMLDEKGDAEAWSELLVDALRGDKILVRRKAQVQLVEFDDGRPKAEKLPFIDLTEFVLEDESPEDATKLLDPWENPWQYRYKIISGGKPSKDWHGPTYLLISAGAEYSDSVDDEDSFVGTMEEDGVPCLDINEDDYYFAEERADNITNFSPQS